MMKPDGEEECLSIAELANMDEVTFLIHAVDDAPGVILTKGNLKVWMPIASRTCSRFKS